MPTARRPTNCVRSSIWTVSGRIWLTREPEQEVPDGLASTGVAARGFIEDLDCVDRNGRRRRQGPPQLRKHLSPLLRRWLRIEVDDTQAGLQPHAHALIHRILPDGLRTHAAGCKDHGVVYHTEEGAFGAFAWLVPRRVQRGPATIPRIPNPPRCRLR